MRAIVVHPNFDALWPLAADHFKRVWEQDAIPLEFVRLTPGDARTLGEALSSPRDVEQLVCLGAPVGDECLERLSNLKEAVFEPRLTDERRRALEAKGVAIYAHTSEGYWSQSVAECALGLTLAALRRIPQLHRRMTESHDPWDYSPKTDERGRIVRGAQFCDEPRFAHGTIAGKRVRIVGAGNIGSRFASFARMLGADVAAWDPYASDPCFHRAGARREWRLDQLAADADIFLPMLPLTDTTRGLVGAEIIDLLPRGCLVVLVTRAGICDMDAVRRRVLADELALAADVFDIEPLPLDDPLLGRHNVVHTPHIAGRTEHANRMWVEGLAARFRPRGTPGRAERSGASAV